LEAKIPCVQDNVPRHHLVPQAWMKGVSDE
jgi:hypothetical protein